MGLYSIYSPWCQLSRTYKSLYLWCLYIVSPKALNSLLRQRQLLTQSKHKNTKIFIQKFMPENGLEKWALASLCTPPRTTRISGLKS